MPSHDATTITSGSGYPDGDDTLNWLGDGMGQTTSTASASGDEITVVVHRASTDNPAPICILTETATASLVSARVVMPRDMDVGDNEPYLWEGLLEDLRLAGWNTQESRVQTVEWELLR